MVDSKIVSLQSIIFLDSLCFGLIYPHISPHLLDIDGTQMHVGIFNALSLLCALISEDIAGVLTTIKGKKFGLYLVFMISVFTHLLLVLTSSYWFIIIVRLMFTLTNESQNYSKQILMTLVPADQQEREIIILSFLSSFGYILGPLIGGYVFDSPSGFTVLGFLCATIAFSNVLILLNIPVPLEAFQPSGTSDPKVLLDKYKDVIKQNLDHFKTFDVDQHWDMFAIKFFFTAGWTMFFSKFTQILWVNFNAGPIIFGHVTAYMNLVAFVVTALMADMNRLYLSKFPLITVINYSFAVHLVALIIICHTRVYEVYWLLCFPLFFTKTYLSSIWQNLFALTSNNDLVALNSTISTAAGVITPVIFGMFCTAVCPAVVTLMSISFVMTSYLIFFIHTKPRYERGAA